MPRIYVASLTDYNSGRLHGVHIDLDGKDSDDVWTEIHAMLKQSPEAKAGYGPAEEVAIHDYEGFHSYRVHEYESIDRLVKVAEFIDKFGVAGAAWLENDTTNIDSDDLEEAFHESYQGHHTNEEDFAFDYIQALGSYREIPFNIFDENHYIFNWDNIKDDLLQDCWTVDDDNEGIHVFRSN